MIRDTKPISGVKGARKEFEKFPERAQLDCRRALTIAAEGSKADIAKPLKGFGSGIFEIAVRYRSDAYRAIDAVAIADAIWVVHAFQKKTQAGIATPKAQVDRVRARIKRLREMLK